MQQTMDAADVGVQSGLLSKTKLADASQDNLFDLQMCLVVPNLRCSI
jgi:hypothetical protein